jgi:hypothetical protein
MDHVQSDFLEKWHRMVEARDISAIGELLAEDVSINSPPYWDKLHGRPLVEHLLTQIITLVEGFTYHRQWHDDAAQQGEIALEFYGHIGELELQGIDLITLNERGEVQNIDVMIRPISALQALQEIITPKMMEFLS